MRKTTLAVIGLGDFGKELVRRLHAEGHETIAVDVALDAVEAVGDQCTEALCLDATDLRALRRLDFDVIDAVILSGSQSFENDHHRQSAPPGGETDRRSLQDLAATASAEDAGT